MGVDVRPSIVVGIVMFIYGSISREIQLAECSAFSLSLRDGGLCFTHKNKINKGLPIFRHDCRTETPVYRSIYRG